MPDFSCKGFTLIELMIVVIIVAILATVAYPSYQKWVRETRRTEAFIALSQLANEMEKFYSECGAYTSTITATPRSCTTPAGPPAGSLGKTNQSSEGNYALSIALPPTAGVPANGYRITATAQAKQSADTSCATLTLMSTGAKGGTSSSCWRN